MSYISYKKGYKYQIVEPYEVNIDLMAPEDIVTEYVRLTSKGRLSLRKGYAWDGPSGPTFDTLNFMRGSLVHDALYQLMREEYLDREMYRKPADRLLKYMCRQDGMSWIRAWWVYIGLRIGGGPAADPANKKPVTKAPRQR